MTTIEVLKSLEQKPEVDKKIAQNCKTPEAFYAEFKKMGLTDSFDVFKEELKKFRDSQTNLSKEEIEAISGGGTETVGTTITTTTTIVPTTAAAAGGAV